MKRLEQMGYKGKFGSNMVGYGVDGRFLERPLLADGFRLFFATPSEPGIEEWVI